MESALNAIFEVLSFGAIIVLVVLGLGIIASMMGIFNFAHGEFVLLGAFTTYLVYKQGLPVWLGMLAAPIVLGAIGFYYRDFHQMTDAEVTKLLARAPLPN